MQPVRQGGAPQILIPTVPMPEAIKQLLSQYRDRFGVPTAGRLLGVDAQPRFSARPGKLFSDYLLAMIDYVRDAFMLERMEGQTPPKQKYLGGFIEVTEATLIDRKRILHRQLSRPETSLSFMRWPLTHPPKVQQITAEDLPAWEIDFATDFVRLTETDVYGCDLRVETKPLRTLAELMPIGNSELRIRLFEQALRDEPSRELQMLEACRVIEEKYVEILKAHPGVMEASERTLFEAHRKASLRLHQKRSD
jgi:hypothetical protein